MEKKEFGLLLSDAHSHLDELSRMVKDTIKVEQDMIDNALKSPLKQVLPFPNSYDGSNGCITDGFAKRLVI